MQKNANKKIFRAYIEKQIKEAVGREQRRGDKAAAKAPGRNSLSKSTRTRTYELAALAPVSRVVLGVGGGEVSSFEMLKSGDWRRAVLFREDSGMGAV